MHTAVHIIPRLFICISSLVSRGDNIDGISRAALTRLAIRDASLEDFHTEGIVSIFISDLIIRIVYTFEKINF